MALYRIGKAIVDQINQAAGKAIISGYLTGQRDGDEVTIDGFVLENFKTNLHLRPKRWIPIVRSRRRTVRQMKDERQAEKEREIEKQYIMENQQRIIDEFITENRAIINAKNHTKELAKDFAANKGIGMRIVYHFHTHPDQTTTLTKVDDLFLKRVQKGVEIIVTSKTVLGYKFEPNEKIRSRLNITQMQFEILE